MKCHIHTLLNISSQAHTMHEVSAIVEYTHACTFREVTLNEGPLLIQRCILCFSRPENSGPYWNGFKPRIWKVNTSVKNSRMWSNSKVPVLHVGDSSMGCPHISWQDHVI